MEHINMICNDCKERKERNDCDDCDDLIQEIKFSFTVLMVHDECVINSVIDSNYFTWIDICFHNTKTFKENFLDNHNSRDYGIMWSKDYYDRIRIRNNDYLKKYGRMLVLKDVHSAYGLNFYDTSRKKNEQQICASEFMKTIKCGTLITCYRPEITKLNEIIAVFDMHFILKQINYYTSTYVIDTYALTKPAIKQ